MDIEDHRKKFHGKKPDNKTKIFVKNLIKKNPSTENEYKECYKLLQRSLKINPSKGDLSSTYQDLLSKKNIVRNKNIETFTRNKSGRSESGIIVVTVVMKPDKFSCPFNCFMCPDERIENGATVDMPRSYLSTEPAEMRAAEVNFDASEQVKSRLDTLGSNNHELDKIEIIVLGGTFSTYPRKYQEEFIRDIFYAANTYFDDSQKRDRKSLIDEQILNEDAKCHIVGLSLETRPDQINSQEIKRLRHYGATRIQLGIQHTKDHLLNVINRQHKVSHSINAITQLKNVGFKIELHIMPDLPEATPEDDIEMMETVFCGNDFQPDYVKIYPCLDVKYTKIREWKQTGKWMPYAEKNNGEDLFRVLIHGLKLIPYWTRDSRVQRDFPKEHKNNGFIGYCSDNIKNNLYQLLLNKLRDSNYKCKSIRNREIKGKNVNVSDAKLFIEEYYASSGKEYFISFENFERNILYGFVRLRLNENSKKNIFKELKEAALIRELHVYGIVTPVKEKENNNAQHYGFGKKLMREAERIAFKNGFKKIAVISSIGTRNYYRKLGYELEGLYMTKKINFLSIFGYYIQNTCLRLMSESYFLFFCIILVILLCYKNN